MFRPINSESKATPGFGPYSPFSVYSIWSKKTGNWSDPLVVKIEDLPKLPITCNTPNYGMSVFEGMKAHEDSKGLIRVFRAPTHFDRFNQSLERIALPTLPRTLFFDSLKAVLSGDARDALMVDFEGGQSLYIRPIVCNSTNKLGPTSLEECLFAVVTAPLLINPFLPIKIVIEKKRSRAAIGGVATAKTAGNYAASAKSVIEANALGFNHVAFTDAHSHLYFEECGSTNLYFVWDGELVTPSLDQGTILNGITRRTIIGAVAKDLNLPVVERRVYVEEFVYALQNQNITEVFVSGTACTNTPVVGVSYEGEEYSLPAYQRNSISHKIHREMNLIYVGETHKGLTAHLF